MYRGFVLGFLVCCCFEGVFVGVCVMVVLLVFGFGFVVAVVFSVVVFISFLFIRDVTWIRFLFLHTRVSKQVPTTIRHYELPPVPHG